MSSKPLRIPLNLRLQQPEHRTRSQVGPPSIRQLDYQPPAVHVLPGGLVPSAAEVAQDPNARQLFRPCAMARPVNDVIRLAQVNAGVNDRQLRPDDLRRARVPKSRTTVTARPPSMLSASEMMKNQPAAATSCSIDGSSLPQRHFTASTPRSGNPAHPPDRRVTHQAPGSTHSPGSESPIACSQ